MQNGFEDVFTATALAAVEVGALPYAKGLIDNQFSHYIRDDGGTNYRANEVAQQVRRPRRHYRLLMLLLLLVVVVVTFVFFVSSCFPGCCSVPCITVNMPLRCTAQHHTPALHCATPHPCAALRNTTALIEHQARMLSILALYHSYSADDAFMLKHFGRAKALADWLSARRAASLREFGAEDPRCLVILVSPSISFFCALYTFLFLCICIGMRHSEVRLGLNALCGTLTSSCGILHGATGTD
jgi:hypothetical protein